MFCTEPFRIPFAGALDTCCFDKTGTLTDDTMTLRGVAGLPTGVQGVPLEAQYVLAGCHALVHVDGFVSICVLLTGECSLHRENIGTTTPFLTFPMIH